MKPVEVKLTEPSVGLSHVLDHVHVRVLGAGEPGKGEEPFALLSNEETALKTVAEIAASTAPAPAAPDSTGCAQETV
jgi:hypothetical protein